jgi:signal peptidase I
MGNEPEAASSPPWWRVALIGRNPKRTLVRLGVLLVVTFVVFKFVLLPIQVEGISMLPTYKDRALDVVNRLAYKSREPQRGDVVAIRLAGEHVMYMKRVIGLPGETIAFHRGKVFIDGEPLAEPYVKLPCHWERSPVRIEPGYYYVVGDNRSMAFGDHKQGQVERDRIIGKVLL